MNLAEFLAVRSAAPPASPSNRRPPQLRGNPRLSQAEIAEKRALAATGIFDNEGADFPDPWQTINWSTINLITPQQQHTPRAEKEPKFVGISEERTARLRELLNFAQNDECEKAFKAAGIETIRDQIVNGITIIAQNILQNPYDDKRWAPNEKFARAMRSAAFWHPNALDISQEGAYEGRCYTSITDRGFNENGDFLSVTLIHALIHTGGKEGRNSVVVTEPIYNGKTGQITTDNHSVITGARHDLEYLGAAYDRVIEACTPEGYSRVGRTRN